MLDNAVVGVRVLIGDVIERVNDRREDPVSSGLDRYVGVDDLDSDDIELRRWGNVLDGGLPPTFRFAFPSGSVLFPTRRPALGKCAVAKFSGITGEKILVLKPKSSSQLDFQFMAYLLASQGVRKWVVDRAIGSVTPHFRWRDLAEYSFSLPPLDVQREVANALKDADELTETYRNLHRRAMTLLEALNRDVFASSGRGKSLSEFCYIDSENLTNRDLESQEERDYVDLSAVTFPGGILRAIPIRLDRAPSRARRVARVGDVLVSTVRPNLRGHAPVLDGRAPLVVSTGFSVLRPKRLEFQPILFGLVLSEHFLRHCESRVAGTNYPAMRPSDIAAFGVPDLSRLAESNFGELYRMVLSTIESSLERYRRAGTSVVPALRNRLMGQ